MDAAGPSPWRITDLEQPNQPPAATIPKMKNSKTGRNSAFLHSWYREYPWIHYCPERQAVLCFHCARAYETGKAREQEPAFTYKGMANWRKALCKFKTHGESAEHANNMPAADLGCQPIEAAIRTADESGRAAARACLGRIITSVQFLARQGLAFRGHGSDEGNFKELLRLRSQDCPELAAWLNRKENFTHHDIQNEVLRLMSHEILRAIVGDVISSGDAAAVQFGSYFSVIVDGTQDVSGLEQESISIRFVDADLQVHEEFVGFYESSSTTGAALAQMIKDALQRLNLPLTALRGMTFDGAANMSGPVKGAQAILRSQLPSALSVHCGAHCVNLVAKDSCDGSKLIKNALGCVNELGVMFSTSGKLRTKYQEVCKEADVTNQKLRPLCPTRWTVRLSAVDAVLSRYEEILQTLENLADGTSHLSTRAAGLHSQLSQGSVLVALHIARAVIAPLDRLSRVLQSETCTVSAMQKCVTTTMTQLQTLRETANQLIVDYLHQAELSSCEAVTLPRKRRCPARLDGGSTGHHPATVQEYLRAELIVVIDMACAQLEARFNQEGVKEHAKMERLLLSARNLTEVQELLDGSPWAGDLSAADLAPQLHVIWSRRRPDSLAAAAEIVSGMEMPERMMVPEVVKLIRLLLTLPATSATAERSFSSLRRLKTWLRSTMSQPRLNALAICHVHRERANRVDVDRIAAAFIELNSSRRRVFGTV